MEIVETTENLRDAELISTQMKAVRLEESDISSWSLQEVADDIQIVLATILTNMPKATSNTHGSKAAKARIRKYLLALETLGAKFRKISI